MAIAAASLVPLRNPNGPGASFAFAQGQISNNGLGGPASRDYEGIAVFTGDGATTSATLNYIDGVQQPFVNTLILPFLSVTAPATIGGVANQAVYSGVGSYGQLRVGQTVTFAGFSNAGNNGAFVINALATSSVQVTNASSVAETNPAATGKVLVGPVLPVVLAYRAGVSATNVADTASNTLICVPSQIGAASCLITFQLPTGVATAPANTTTIAVFARLTSVV